MEVVWMRASQVTNDQLGCGDDKIKKTLSSETTANIGLLRFVLNIPTVKFVAHVTMCNTPRAQAACDSQIKLRSTANVDFSRHRTVVRSLPPPHPPYPRFILFNDPAILHHYPLQIGSPVTCCRSDGAPATTWRTRATQWLLPPHKHTRSTKKARSERIARLKVYVPSEYFPTDNPHHTITEVALMAHHAPHPGLFCRLFYEYIQ